MISAIRARVAHFMTTLPPHIECGAAAKTRSPEEVQTAIEAGIRIVGHNYVQEAEIMIDQLGREAATWTMIGHLQRNKVGAAVRLFDSIQTVDSLRLAEAIDRECRTQGRTMPVLIEVNAAREAQKSGVPPEDVLDLVRETARLTSLRIRGLMTLGPLVDDPEALRPVFRRTKELFDRVAAAHIPNVSMDTLSMGMSDSYEVAIEEGTTMIRLGTALFGPRT